MTPPEISQERALEIIAAYGADSRRWPADEREAVTLIAVVDPAVAAALADARGLDGLLAGWARDVVPAAPLDAASLIPAPAATVPAALGQRRWWAGAAVAAGVAALVAMQVPFGATPGAPPVQLAVQSPATPSPNVSPAPSAAGESQALDDDEVFAAVFTPTADEDQLI